MVRLVLSRAGVAVAAAVVALATGNAALPAAAAERLPVVAAFSPLAEAAQVVGGPDVRVANLTPPGAEPHDLELSTDDRDRIADAGLVVVMGDGFQPAVEAAADDRDGPTVRVLDAIGVRRSVAEHDPHVWLDPVLMQRVVTAVEQGLAKADPANARAFARRADAYRAELMALDGEYRAGLADCARTLVVTSHEAFGWLAKRYGLRQEGVAGIDPDAEPDPKRLGELADLAHAKGVTTVFTEALVSPKVAETLAREAGGLDTVVLSPLEGLTDRERSRGDDYLSVMRVNLEKLRRALGCR